MRERLKVLIVLLAALLLLLVVGAHAETIKIVTTTERYQLDNGMTVYVWLDEPHGLLCEAIGGVGLTCIPLTASVYNWPAIYKDDQP